MKSRTIAKPTAVPATLSVVLDVEEVSEEALMELSNNEQGGEEDEQ